VAGFFGLERQQNVKQIAPGIGRWWGWLSQWRRGNDTPTSPTPQSSTQICV